MIPGDEGCSHGKNGTLLCSLMLMAQMEHQETGKEKNVDSFKGYC